MGMGVLGEVMGRVLEWGMSGSRCQVEINKRSALLGHETSISLARLERALLLIWMALELKKRLRILVARTHIQNLLFVSIHVCKCGIVSWILTTSLFLNDFFGIYATN